MAYGEKRNDGPNGWRARYKKPNGTWGTRSGFSSEKAATDWGDEQEALIRRSMWIDPIDAQTPYGDFAQEWLDAVKSRLSPGTVVKYQSYLDNQLFPQWEDWPVIGIFNGYIEIEKWLSEVHEEYAESTVASVFSTFSTTLGAAVRARMIPANPCAGVRVTSGDFEIERLVAAPVHGLRAAMRLYETGLGLSGFTLCLADLYTGARWSELVGQQRHEYDDVTKAIRIKEPLKEVNGKVTKGSDLAVSLVTPEEPAVTTGRRKKVNRSGRTKTPAGTRWVDLPPSIAVFYELLMNGHDGAFVFSSAEGHPMRRSNFRQRYWRSAWDGVDVDYPQSRTHVPPILADFTFHEGRHTHSTWMIEDGIPEVARRARLGQKMKGIARTYDHVTPVMRQQILDGLELRWAASLAGLTASERRRLVQWFPHLEDQAWSRLGDEETKIVSHSSPIDLGRQQKTLTSAETRAL